MAEIKPTFSTWPWQYWAEVRPHDVAIALGDINNGAKKWTWEQVSIKVDAYAQSLAEQGVKRDQLIAVIAPNSIDVVWLILAILRLGARYVGLNPKLSSTELHAQLMMLENDFIWFSDSEVHFSSQEIALPGKRISLFLSKTERMIPVTWQAQRPVTLTLTSGSTGLPKAVVHSSESHLASASGLLTEMTFTAQDSWLLSLPLFHISGLAIIWRWLYRGAQLMIVEPQCHQQALQWVTHASLVPTQLQRFLASENVSQHHLKQVLLGGTTIPVSLTTKARLSKIECWSGYGMTEMASTVTVKLANNTAGVGTLLPLRELILREGEILVRGQALCLGYYRNKTIFSLLSDTDHDGEWFATKDLGEWCDGELFIRGRADNMFISGGENVQPEDIEQVLLQHSAVTQAFVVPITDYDFGARPIAVINTELPLEQSLIEELTQYMAKNVAPYKRPLHYLTLPSHLVQGIKISRATLIKWVATQY